MIETNDESCVEVLQPVFGKEHLGAMHCYGRSVTQTGLKRISKINAIKKAHNEEVIVLNEKLECMEDKLSKLQYAFRALLSHCKLGDDVESIEGLLGSSPRDATSMPKVMFMEMMLMKTWNMDFDILKHFLDLMAFIFVYYYC